MKNSFIIAFILFCFVVSCKKESSNTNFEVRNQLGNIILDSKTIANYTKQMVKDRYSKDIDFKITNVTTSFDDKYYITTIEYELPNNIKTNFILSNSTKFKSQEGTIGLQSRSGNEGTVRIYCSGTCQCSIQGSNYNFHCACRETEQPSGTTCSMTIENVSNP